MNYILLTQDSGFLKPIVWVLGKIMDVIFNVIDFIGIPNIGLAIILFTIIVNLLMMPLTIKQQKFSKLSAKVQPEIQAIQAKYKNKKDNESMMAQNAEIQAVYAKYGISPSGSCLYLLIQMPILFSLYRVIYSMPAYVTKIGDTFRVLASKIISTDNAAFLQNNNVESIKNTVAMYGQSMTEGNLENGVVDVLNKLSSADLATVASHYDLNGLTYADQLILSNDTTRGLIETYNNFLGLNIGDSPWNIIKDAFAVGAWLMLIGAVLIPVLSAVTQWINVKLMPQASSSDNQNKSEMASSMEASMKSMNLFMPIFSAWLCFTLPCGMGIYWIAGSVFRGIQQIMINKHLDKVDINELIEKNKEKSAKKIAQLKEQQERMNAYANMNTRSIQSRATINNPASDVENNNKTNNTPVNYTVNAKPGSMMAKANMVREYNEKNNK